MNPWFLTDFTDGEGCFHVSVFKYNEYKLGWKIQLSFEIHLKAKDIALLIQIKNLFCVGKIYIKEKSILFRATSIKDLSVIIDHFEKYPLITDKWSGFRLFKLAFKLI